jgi:hypothetical protein
MFFVRVANTATHPGKRSAVPLSSNRTVGANGRTYLYRRLLPPLGSDRSRSQRDFLRRENQNRRLIRACAPDRACTRCSFQLEERTGRQEPISFSESGQTRPADHYGQNRLEDGAKERGSGLLSDLPLRHVFCTRLSWVAPDAVVQRAMRHSSPETKRHYQLGMVEQLRQNLEKANERVYGQAKALRFHDVLPEAEKGEELVVCK